jgi:hypothetical protein
MDIPRPKKPVEAAAQQVTRKDLYEQVWRPAAIDRACQQPPPTLVISGAILSIVAGP